MPYQCTACNKSFRYKISQRTHKCTANPPGIVVRTNGSLVERLQAAMIKAAVVSDNKTLTNDITAENLPSPANGTSCVLHEIKTSLESFNNRISAKLIPQNNEMASSSLAGSISEVQCTKTSGIEKNTEDKPQIYLLVKGPNEETYYQPLLLSQNNNLIVSQNNSSPMLENTIKKFKYKPREKCTTDLKTNVDQIYMNSDNCDLNHQSEEVSPVSKHFIPEKQKKNLDMNKLDGHCQIMKSTFHWLSNGKEHKNEPSPEIKDGSVNIFSGGPAMNDIITNLTSEFPEIQSSSESNVQKAVSLKTGSSNDMIMMDSSDIFSLVLSPSLSSPSECFGRLSLSPNSTNHQILINDNVGSSEIFSDNYNGSNDEPHDYLFDNISDDTLKELLFGSSK